ncbi:SagB family peptide dehydrogenase [Saccharothrix carnea]|uniref:SagB family peptide dehydrogenase n=1 Tax=Saccharothrix carnea TaxID=1280637 RepID=UPI0011B2044B|nr:SagB family peptide dehydrogenase [Saccharothrix carnea]
MHLLCRTGGPHRVAIGGVLGLDGVREGPHTLTVQPSGSWTVRPGVDEPVAARFPRALVAPALHDAHVHLGTGVDLSDYVAYGVSRVRDLGSVVGTELEVPLARRCTDLVPEIVLGGPLVDGTGRRRRFPFAVEWDGPDDLPSLVDSAAARGARWLKLYTRFPTALYGPVVAHAHARGLKVTAHPGPGAFPAAVRAGVDELQHLVCLTPFDDRGTHALHRRWATRRPEDRWPRVPAGTAVCPTLVVHHRLLDEAERGWAFTGHDPALVGLWRAMPVVAKPWTDAEFADAHAAIAAMADAVPDLHRAGVRWTVGSDTPNPGVLPGRSMWEEMNLLMAAGLGKTEVFASAAVAKGLGDSGDDALVVLPLSAFGPGPFPVEPVTAVLQRGCLFVAEHATRVVTRTRYQRSPWLYLDWGDEKGVVAVDSRSQRRFRVRPDMLPLLTALATPTLPEEVTLPGYSPDRLADLLRTLVDLGIVHAVGADGPVRHSEWTPGELAVHAQAGRGGKPRMRARDIPPAHLVHRDVTRTIRLPEPDLPSRSLADVLLTRRSIRDFDTAPLSLTKLSTFLGRAARVRGRLGPELWQTTRRPSAAGGGRHSLELYLVVRAVDDLEAGAYHYDPFDHALHRLQPWTPELHQLQHQLLCRPMVVDTAPPVSFYLASYFRRVQCKYGAMTLSVIYRDTGCLLQTLYLVAADLDLAACATAATETEPTPTFLREHREDLIHTANFALGLPAPNEPNAVDFHPR